MTERPASEFKVRLVEDLQPLKPERNWFLIRLLNFHWKCLCTGSCVCKYLMIFTKEVFKTVAMSQKLSKTVVIAFAIESRKQ